MPLNVPCLQNKRLKQVVERIDQSPQLDAYWSGSNITAIDRMGINDHGPVHVRIMTNIGLKLLRLLSEGGVTPSAVANHGLTDDEAEIVVVLACVLHDIGHVIHREEHELPSHGRQQATWRPQQRRQQQDHGRESHVQLRRRQVDEGKPRPFDRDAGKDHSQVGLGRNGEK